ncbi:MAG: hypothetical protein J6B60_06320 [Clostridia bacterium]|nr:hypothetical protein [Clostridia bacterium]
MTINKKEKNEGRVKITVTRCFGTENLIEIYSDYVAKKIRELLHLKRENKDEDKS